MAIEAYCVKCKGAKKVMTDPEGVTKNGKPITKGKCPDCGYHLPHRQGQVTFADIAASIRSDEGRPAIRRFFFRSSRWATKWTPASV